MSKKIEMIGKRFTRLVVVEEVEPLRKGRPRFRCVCDCGGEKIAEGSALRSGNVRSCGCLRKEMGNAHELIDMVGKKFNRLTILEEVGVNKRNQRMFRCLCDCGNECIAEGYEIRSGRKKSCGCIKNEEKVENRKAEIIGKKFGRLLVVKEIGGKLRVSS